MLLFYNAFYFPASVLLLKIYLMPQKSEVFPDTENDAIYVVVRGLASAVKQSGGSEVHHLASPSSLPDNAISAGQLVFDSMAESHGLKLVKKPNLVD